MRKIRPENLKIMISNLNEAAGDLCELEARLDYAVNERMPKGWEGFDRIWNRHPFLTSTLYVIFEHVYHHINFAWNSRFVSASRVIACATRDYERWEKFPDDFATLKALRKAKPARSVFDGDLKRGGWLCDGSVHAAELRTHDVVWGMAVFSACTYCDDGRADSGGAVFHGAGTEENVGRKDMDWAGYGLRYVGYADLDRTMPLDV